jgi:delta24(24(1))-sterol reductase
MVGCSIISNLFVIYLAVFAAYMPGLTMYGVPTAPKGERLPYHCNGYVAYYSCIIGSCVVHYFGYFDLTYIADHFGEFLIAAMVIGDVTSVMWYVYGLLHESEYEQPNKPTGNIIYDIFMGTCLYPRLSFFPNGYVIDIKMVAECRWSWTTLMVLTLSCGLKQYREVGHITKEMAFMLYAHWLYSNATAKGEHCVTGTWDMFHENFGWMLNFWNIAGVPFLYCFQSFYILKNYANLDRQLPTWFIVAVWVLLNVAYYVFDSANCQKASDKLNGLKRNTFPQVPWNVLEQPVRYIETPKVSALAVSAPA